MLPNVSHAGLIVGSLRTVEVRPAADTRGWRKHAAPPFVTISADAGTGGHALGRMLAERLTRLEQKLSYAHEAEHPWQFLDRALVERIAADHHLSADLIESLEHSSHTWIDELFAGLSGSAKAPPSGTALVRRVAEIVRAVSQAGHVVLVGLAGVFITQNMPGGIHLRLVAPLDHRVAATAGERSMSIKDATRLVKADDDERYAFFRTYWPNQPLSDDLFHLTLNTARLTPEQMLQAILPLVEPMIRLELQPDRPA
jgi:cytidylate kinase